MHPNPIELRQFAKSDRLSRARWPAIQDHLDQCATCRDYVGLIEDWNLSLDWAVPESAEAHSLADRVFMNAVTSMGQPPVRVIELKAMVVATDPLPIKLAADGQPTDRPVTGLEHAATHYAEDPELVLRIMRDRQTGEESLHLIGPNTALTANVMLQIVEPPLDFITDNLGVARLGDLRLSNPESLKWQVRLPDAVFALSPLEFNPERPGAQRDFELQTDADNRIQVSMQNRPEGIMLQLRLLRIAGNDKLKHARLVITQEDANSQTVEAPDPAAFTIRGLQALKPISIRIFAE